MYIQYCPSCKGLPYTKTAGVHKCPLCGSMLAGELVDESKLSGRPKLPESSNANMPQPTKTRDAQPTKTRDTSGAAFDPFREPDSQKCPAARPEQKPAEDPVNQAPAKPYVRPAAAARPVSVNNFISGKIVNYSNTDKEGGRYRRFMITKIIDALVYGQRTEDVLHRFNVHSDNGSGQFTDIPVNVHGTISGGAPLADNMQVEVEGKYRNGIMMARRIRVVNNGYGSDIAFQHSPAMILYAVLAVLIAGAAIFALVFGKNHAAGIRAFFMTWLVSAIITLVLYLMFFARPRWFRRWGFPWVGILLVSLLLAILWLNRTAFAAAFGAAVSPLLAGIGPILIMLIGLWILIKVIFP